MQDQLQTFRRHLRLAFAIPVLLAAVVGGIFVAQAYYLRANVQALERSYRIQGRSRTALRMILDMETGLRGYLLTGEDHFLGSYRAAEPRVEPTLNDLLNLVRSDPEQYRAVVRMQTYYADWHDYSRRMMALQQRSADVSDFRLNLEGKQYVDLIRRDSDEVIQLEQNRLRERLDDVTITLTRLFVTIIVISLLLGVAFATFSRKELHSAAASYDEALQTAEQRSSEIRENQRWLSAVLGSIGDSVIVTENTGKIVFTNPVAKRLLDNSKQMFAGQRTTDVIRLVDEVSREPIVDPHRAVMESGATVAPSSRVLLVRGDGSEIPVSQVASLFRDENNNAIGVVIVLRDLTHQRMSEKALQSSEKLANMGRLAASVAHEIHNPLDALGNLLYLLEHQAMDESGKTYVRLAREELERITSISEQMLTFSREARQPVSVYLSDVIENVLSLFLPRIRRMGVVLVKQYASKDGSVLALPGEMRQVFSNLVGNALDAMNGAGRLIIRIEEAHRWSSPEEAGVRVMVCDTGPGIPEEVRGNLMEPFVTSKGEKGTGLGLWVCCGIVEKYHGWLRFRSSTRPEKSGTCFAVFLPNGIAKEDRSARVGGSESVEAKSVEERRAV
jgi:PAS domain S-box-containing protein